MILSGVSLGLMRQSVMESRLFQNFGDQASARALASGGLRLALMRLAADSNDYDSLYECGIRLMQDERPDDLFDLPSKEGRVQVGYQGSQGWVPGMSDEDRKLNINAAGEAALAALLMRAGGIRDLRRAQEIAFAIIDWRDEDHDDSCALAAEEEYYRSLAHAYPCADRPFRVPEELTLVRGITQELFEKIRPYVTVFGSSFVQINANTASRPVLESVLIGAGIPEETAPALADELLRYRAGRDLREGTADDPVFSPGFQEMRSAFSAEQMSIVQGVLKTNSQLFRIESTGRGAGNICVTQTGIFHKLPNRISPLVSSHES